MILDALLISKKLLVKYYSLSVADGKTVFLYSLLRLMNDCVESIYKTQKTRTKFCLLQQSVNSTLVCKRFSVKT